MDELRSSLTTVENQKEIRTDYQKAHIILNIMCLAVTGILLYFFLGPESQYLELGGLILLFYWVIILLILFAIKYLLFLRSIIRSAKQIPSPPDAPWRLHKVLQIFILTPLFMLLFVNINLLSYVGITIFKKNLTLDQWRLDAIKSLIAYAIYIIPVLTGFLVAFYIRRKQSSVKSMKHNVSNLQTPL